jgi:hypothetical protein
MNRRSACGRDPDERNGRLASWRERKGHHNLYSNSINYEPNVTKLYAYSVQLYFSFRLTVSACLVGAGMGADYRIWWKTAVVSSKKFLSESMRHFCGVSFSLRSPRQRPTYVQSLGIAQRRNFYCVRLGYDPGSRHKFTEGLMNHRAYFPSPDYAWRHKLKANIWNPILTTYSSKLKFASSNSNFSELRSWYRSLTGPVQVTREDFSQTDIRLSS